MRVLLAEDDSILSDGITIALRQSGYAVDCVHSGEEADYAISNYPYDAVVLDLGLPLLDGLDVLKNARERGLRVPILILTARDTVEDRIIGLDLGADDYLIKPFALPELEARIRALIRRNHSEVRSELIYGPIRLDLSSRRVYVQDESVDLAPRELGILEVLLMHVGQIVSKEQLVEHLYGWEEEVGENAIEVYIHRLRKKLEPAGFNFRTIRGLGYLVENSV